MNENQFVIEAGQLSKDALNNIIEDFILREGTDYGISECDLQTKKKRVLKLLDSKQILILYDDELGSCNLISVQDSRTSIS